MAIVESETRLYIVHSMAEIFQQPKCEIIVQLRRKFWTGKTPRLCYSLANGGNFGAVKVPISIAQLMTEFFGAVKEGYIPTDSGNFWKVKAPQRWEILGQIMVHCSPADRGILGCESSKDTVQPMDEIFGQ